tara:strand:- start:826 stop:1197 length:372 start_codon:yes stop_codon:yes gene_type:complete
MDIIFIQDLKVHIKIGVWNWERNILQTLIINLEFARDLAEATRTDNIDDTVDYEKVTERIKMISEKEQFCLLEALGERLVSSLFDEFDLSWIKLSLTKLGAVEGARAVGIILERGEKVGARSI